MTTTIPHTVNEPAAWEDLRDLQARGRDLSTEERRFCGSLRTHLLQGGCMDAERWTRLIQIRGKRL